ncbi:hypothetical protein RJ640_021951 [Escallonia rubra]|uniref:DEAD-box ATP-dependent RNA helicase 39 n=1 Tax=Escallonia rubra TaxID=112253 RepID=A0AA88RLH0_9ASTE|nr:hypothetical protein RJ640_021951 [Escallonia rubra]
MGGTGRALLSLSYSSSTTRLPFSVLSISQRFTLPKPLSPPNPPRVYLGVTVRPLCTTTTTATDEAIEPLKHSILLEKLRIRHLKDTAKTPQAKTLPKSAGGDDGGSKKEKKGITRTAASFYELGLSDEVMGALEEMGISVPTEIQSIGVPAVLGGKSVVLGSHTGSGKTLAYMLPLVQLLRRDEALYGMLMKPRRPRAVVLCPTRELSEQVFRVSKSISHHARFRSTMISGGGRLRPQEDSLNTPIDMVVGTPGRILQHIEDGNMVLDEADTMFDRGFGPDIRKFLGPLKNRASKSDGLGFQTVLVTATMAKGVQNLVDEEFQGIVHLRTSSLHKKIASARHDFIKLSGSENKLEALLQVDICSFAFSLVRVDHFLDENQISTVNYHGEVPAEQRVENLKKFKTDDGDCPTLVCTDLAARGLDLDVDHVIMFDFPLNSIDYLHRTGRTARMGAKGKVTSLVSRKDQALASRIEEAIMKNESLESLTVDNVKRDTARSWINQQTAKNSKLVKVSNQTSKNKAAAPVKSSAVRGKPVPARKTSGTKAGKAFDVSKSKIKVTKPSKPVKSSSPSSSKGATPGGKKKAQSRKLGGAKFTSKLNVVGFRGRSSSSTKKQAF